MSESDFEVEDVHEGVKRIALAPPPGIEEAVARAVNVYLVEGHSKALINVGHPGCTEALTRALHTLDVSPADIERIIATSWQIDVLGAATHFPGADLFVLSPDMRAPGDYEAQVNQQRDGLMETAETLGEADDGFDVEPVRRAVQRYFPAVTRDLRFIPLRNGHFVNAGALRLEVLATGGPGPGHMALYNEDEKLLFCGDFAVTGLPRLLENTQSYLVGLQRLAELPSEKVLPNEGRTYKQGRWTMSRAANFINNFLSNVPAALVRGPTVVEFIERDRGYPIEDSVELVVAYRRFRRLFDELVRAGTVAAEGEGVQRRYGVDVEDPREKLRR